MLKKYFVGTFYFKFEKPITFILIISVAYPDPGYGAFLTPESGQNGKKYDPGSGLNIPDPAGAYPPLLPTVLALRSVLPGGGRSSRPHFPITMATLRHFTAKIFIYTACFLTF
jgi:hypothetical protein